GVHRMVTWNSTAAYEALTRGIPVTCDPSAAYASVAELDDVEAAQRLLNRMAYTQWTIDEIRAGACWRALGHPWVAGGEPSWSQVVAADLDSGAEPGLNDEDLLEPEAPEDSGDLF